MESQRLRPLPLRGGEEIKAETKLLLLFEGGKNRPFLYFPIYLNISGPFEKAQTRENIQKMSRFRLKAPLNY